MNICKIFLSIIAIIFLSNCCGPQVVQGWYKGRESENYTILRKENKIEIREYHQVTIAKVDAQGERPAALAQGQKILYDYFFEKNNFEEEINLTTPLTQRGSGHQWKIYLTVPLSYTLESAGQIELAQPFEVATSSKLKTLLLADEQKNQTPQIAPEPVVAAPKIQPLPIPLDERIQISTTKPTAVVAIIFSGFVTQKNLDKNLRELENYIAKENIKVVKPHFYAFYDSAFTLPFNRRIEILFTLSDDHNNDIFKKMR